MLLARILDSFFFLVSKGGGWQLGGYRRIEVSLINFNSFTYLKRYGRIKDRNESHEKNKVDRFAGGLLDEDLV